MRVPSFLTYLAPSKDGVCGEWSLETTNSQPMKNLILLVQVFSVLGSMFLASCAEEPVATSTTTTTRETTVAQPTTSRTTTTSGGY
jgi:hypothetical protein